MKKMIKLIWIVCMAMVMCLSNLVNVFASGAISEKQGSITVNYEVHGQVFADIGVDVFQITALNEDEEHDFLPKFESFGDEFDVDFVELTDNESWIYVADNLENYINLSDITPDVILYTDEQGECKAEDLDLGIYFIQFEEVCDYECVVCSESVLLSVVATEDAAGEEVYSYEVNPKISILALDEVQELTVRKYWENTNSDSLIPDEIEVALYCDGEVYDVVALSKENLWTYSWVNMDIEKTWAVQELTHFSNFEVSYEKNVFDFTITNTYTKTPNKNTPAKDKDPSEDDPSEEDEPNEPNTQATPEEIVPSNENIPEILEMSEEKLPQTGSNEYMIPILASLGLVFILLGILLGNQSGGKEND